MTITFNHTISAARDRHESARFYRDLFELTEAPSWGPFTDIALGGGVLLQFAEPPVEIQMQHYAFVVDDDLFDRAYARPATPAPTTGPTRTSPAPARPTPSTRGRWVYFLDPAARGLEMITRP